MSKTTVTDQQPDRATVRAVLSATESNLLLGGLARKGITPRKDGPYTIEGAVRLAAGGDATLVTDALAATGAATVNRDLNRWLATNPDRIEVGKVLQTAIRRLSVAAVR